MKATIFLVCSMVCVLFAAACSIFGHSAWIAVFEQETKKRMDQDPRYPPEITSVLEANSRLALLNAFYKVNGYTPTVAEVSRDPECQLDETSKKKPCELALKHESSETDCYKSCIEAYYDKSGCFNSQSREPTQHCWNVFAGMVNPHKTIPIPSVTAKDEDFSSTQKVVYDAIRNKDPFFLSDWTKIITDKACKRLQTNISDKALNALGGADCVSIRNDPN